MVKLVEASEQMPDLWRHSKQGMLQGKMKTNHMISDMLDTKEFAMLTRKVQRTKLTSWPSAFLINQGRRN